MAIQISLEKLLESGAHFGHQMRRWNPQMSEYMHAVKDGVYVFDLIKTQQKLEEALEVLSKAAADKKSILLVGTKKQFKDAVVTLGQETGIFYVNERWLGGTLTNFTQVQRSIQTLADLEKIQENALALGYTKKERLLMQRKMEKLKKSFGGILTMKGFPDLMVVLDTHHEYGALREARRLKIPVIGIVDSNADPSLVDWPIPMNDDASGAVNYVLDLMKQAILGGQSAPEKKEKVSKKKLVKKEE